MRKNAFTLIEIIITLAIVAILAAPVVVSIYSHVTIASEETVRENLSFLIDKARLVSSASNVPVYMSFDPEKQTVNISKLKHQSLNAISANDDQTYELITFYKLPKTVEMISFATNGDTLANNMTFFYPDGTSNNAEIEISVNGKHYIYIINNSGVIRNTTGNDKSNIINLDKDDVSADDVFR